MDIGLQHYLVASGALFSLGLFGIIFRRNLIVVFMCLELMLNAANLTLVAFSRFTQHMDGQIFVFFTITVAAAEVAVGLALVVAIFRIKGNGKTESLKELKF